MYKSLCSLFAIFILSPSFAQSDPPEYTDEALNAVALAEFAIFFGVTFAGFESLPDPFTGPDDIFDYSNLDEDYQVEISLQEPENSNGSENFESATHAKKIQAGSFSQVVEFFGEGTNILEKLGNWNNTTGVEQVQVCNDPSTLYIFPIQYKSTWQDNFQCEKQPPYVGFQSDNSGSYQALCEGYGTLILPNGEYEDVLRVKFIEEGKITNFSDGQQIGLDKYSRTIYHWLKEGYPFPLLSYTNTVYGGNIPELQGSGVTEWMYMMTDPLSDNYLEQILNLTRIYPNPANSYIELSNLEGLSQEVITYEIISLNGEIIQNGSLDRATNQTRLDVSQLSSGFYALKLHTEKASVTKKLIIN